MIIQNVSERILLHGNRHCQKLNISGMIFLVILTFLIGMNIVLNDHIYFFGSAVYIDSLSQIQLIIITTVSFITAIYSHKYIGNEYMEKIISLKKAKGYFILFQVFVLSMIFLCVSNNIMGMWIGLEATTLSTAFPRTLRPARKRCGCRVYFPRRPLRD